MLNPKDFVVIDVETSGANPYQHQLLSVAMVPLDETIAPLSVFIRQPQVTWTTVAKEYFENYRDDWERHAVTPLQAARDIDDYLKTLESPRLTGVGHNIGFDFAFMRQLFSEGEFPSKLSSRAIDTYTLLRLLSWRREVPSEACSSSGAFKHFDIDIPPKERHSALGDALATRTLFLKLLNELKVTSLSN